MEEEPKKQEMEHISEEELKLRQKRQDELKFQIHQKQQLVQLQQKQAEAYNLAHPGQFASAYSSHGSIHHILPPVTEEYDDLMPDPMQYVSLMGAPPPPPIAETIHIAEVHSEPVLPPGNTFSIVFPCALFSILFIIFMQALTKKKWNIWHR